MLLGRLDAMLVKIDSCNFLNLEQVEKICLAENPFRLDFVMDIKGESTQSIFFDCAEERDNFFKEMLHFYDTGSKIFYGPIL